MADVQPNVGNDPINPAYYAGTACAEIIEHMPTNVGIAVKYAWRLGEKDSEAQEAGKAIWYLNRQVDHAPAFRKPDALWFRLFASHRIINRAQEGKIDLRRSEFIGECVEYTVTGDRRHLDRAVELFLTYT
jgi:hypothetical protein